MYKQSKICNDNPNQLRGWHIDRQGEWVQRADVGELYLLEPYLFHNLVWTDGKETQKKYFPHLINMNNEEKNIMRKWENFLL